MQAWVPMGVRRFDDLIAWQRADDFKREVQRIVLDSDEARRDVRYRGQVLDAASAVSKDISEGFLRCSPAAFACFLGYALGSLVEAEQRLKDGIERGYFPAEDCIDALQLARRCFTATIRLKKSQDRYRLTAPRRR